MTDLIVKTIDRFASNARYTVNEGVESGTRLLLGEVCKRPELRPLLGGVHFNIDDSLSCLFRVATPNVFELQCSVLNAPALAAFCIRFGLELIMLDRVFASTRDSVHELARSVLALHTASSYYRGMIDQEKDSVVNHLPQWLHEAISGLHAASDAIEPPVSIAAQASEYLDKLQAFSRADREQWPGNDFTAALKEQVCRITVPLLDFARPSEQILTQGGDSRLLVDVHTGLNQYGCSPRPRPWAITFSSCTSSSISDLAYQETEYLRQTMLSRITATTMERAFCSAMASVREEVKKILLLDHIPGVEIITTPSGTDAELFALHIAMGLSLKSVRNIVISSIEIGSGAILAAGGRHFDDRTPLGWEVEVGEPLDGVDVERVEVRTVEVRHETGKVTTHDGMDTQVKQLTSEAVAAGKVVLLHLLDSSKTGIGGPSIAAVSRLKQQYGESLFVVVDAAQMRLGRDLLQMYLKSGFMVMITGSKFFTGPPFSGALLIPGQYSSRMQELPPFPSGLAAYATKHDIPEKWQQKAEHLSDEANTGLMMRWQGALWEMQAFYSVAHLERYRTIKLFGEEVVKSIERNPDLELVSAPIRDRGGVDVSDSWDQLPSIFTFLVLKKRSRDEPAVPLSYDEARFAYRCLNMDISRFLPVAATDREHQLAANRCHTGQPVRIKKLGDEWMGALRIAAGARLVSGVQFDPALGGAPEQRLDTEIHTARILLDKLSVIVRYWDVLGEYDIDSGVMKGAGFYLF